MISWSCADILRTIRDPEKPSTLEDLNVVYEEGIFVQNPTSDNVNVVSVCVVNVYAYTCVLFT